MTENWKNVTWIRYAQRWYQYGKEVQRVWWWRSQMIVSIIHEIVKMRQQIVRSCQITRRFQSLQVVKQINSQAKFGGRPECRSSHNGLVMSSEVIRIVEEIECK